VLAVLAVALHRDAQTVRYRIVPLTEISSAQTSCVPTAINTPATSSATAAPVNWIPSLFRWH
jgi:hypothetical protein